MIHSTKNVQIGHFGASDDHTIRIRTFFEAAEVNEAAEVSKAWKITTEVFKVFQVLEFNNMRTLF